jgi:hypothetical protein
MKATQARPRVKTLGIIAGLCLCAFIGAILLVVTGGKPATTARPTPLPSTSMTPVMTVNGTQVPVREFMLFVEQDRATTITFFQQHYNATVDANFWTTSYGGTTPREQLLKSATTDATRTLVQQQSAQTQKLVANIDYADFLTAWATENQRRRQAIAAHQPVYGPEQYTESQYFSYLFGNLTYALELRLIASGTITVTAATERAYYASHRSEFAASSASTSGVQGPTTTASDPFAAVQQQVKQACQNAAYAAWASAATNRATVSTMPSVLSRVPIS